MRERHALPDKQRNKPAINANHPPYEKINETLTNVVNTRHHPHITHAHAANATKGVPTHQYFPTLNYIETIGTTKIYIVSCNTILLCESCMSKQKFTMEES
jgi:hypothetical protein